MLIVDTPPPNFAAIKLVFPEAEKAGVMFCYGDTIYNPSGNYIEPQLIAHEEVHSARQAGIGVETWWARYLDTPQFRFNEELLAHITEYHDFIKRNKSREMRRNYLRAVAERLSGPLYGNACSLADALTSIERGRIVRKV